MTLNHKPFPSKKRNDKIFYAPIIAAAVQGDRHAVDSKLVSSLDDKHSLLGKNRTAINSYSANKAAHGKGNDSSPEVSLVTFGLNLNCSEWNDKLRPQKGVGHTIFSRLLIR